MYNEYTHKQSHQRAQTHIHMHMHAHECTCMHMHARGIEASIEDEENLLTYTEVDYLAPMAKLRNICNECHF